jgi:hypothetical protein
MSGAVTDYDSDVFRQCLAGNNLEDLEGKTIVLMVGKIGAGKSTATTVQLGGVYQYDEEQMVYVLKSSPCETPRTALDYTAKTLNITGFKDPEVMVYYVDTPGINENRGHNQELYTHSCLYMLYSLVKEFKAVVVVVNYQEVFTGRADGFAAFAQEITQATLGLQFLSSMVFLFTNVRKSPPYTLTQVLNKVRGVLGARRVSRDALIAKKIHTVQEKEMLCSLQAQISILEMMSNTDKIVLSDPEGSDACRNIRSELLRKVQSFPPVSTLQLRTVRDKKITDSTLLFNDVLAKVAADYVPDLFSLSTLLDELVKRYALNAEELNAISNDWKSYRRNKVGKARDNASALETQMTINKDSIRILETCTDEEVLFEQPIIKSVTTSFFYVEWIVGMLTASESFTYRGILMNKCFYSMNNFL